MWLDCAALLLSLWLVAGPTGGVSVASEENVMLNPRKVINHISKEFVCFSAKPRSVFEDSLNPVSETTFLMANKLSPMYLKVYGDSSQLELQMDGFVLREDDSELVQITPNGWRAFDNWAQEAGLVPVFVLDYSGENWKPRNALKVLTVANKLGIKNCLWQLGTGNITNAVKYIEDLRAFRAITNAFKYRGIVACDVDPKVVGFDQTRYFNLNVDEFADAVSVIYDSSNENQRLKEFVLQRETYLRGPARSHLPIWLDVKSTAKAASPSKLCSESCLQSGLRYATLLGDAARNGFNAVFKTLSRQEVQTYSLTYLIALLHKATIGTKVFEVPQIAESDVQIYAYCSRSGNGSFALFAINHQSEDFEFDIKLTSKQHSMEVQQYILTVVDGVIHLNSEPFDFGTHLAPLAKIQPILKGLQLNIPAQAVAFWVIPNLNLRECFDDYQDLRSKVSRSVTVFENSVDQLLQELIAERAKQQDITQISRRKRSLQTEHVESEVAPRKSEGAKAKGKRPPRQTLNYRRRERTIRKKEKRAERKNLKQLRRPLRERGKRQSRRRSQCVNPSKLSISNKKTKRSSLAEAVNEPPVFGESYEEQVNRSSFPQGDVHLVISKGPEEEELLSIEEAPIRETRTKYRRKTTMNRKHSSEKDLRFVIPEVAPIREQGIPRPELEAAESIHRQISLNEPDEVTKPPKVFQVDRQMVGEKQQTSKSSVSALQQQEEESDLDTLRAEVEGMDDDESMDGEESKDVSASDSSDNLSLPDHSLGASPELGDSLEFSDENFSKHSSEAYVEQIYRRKRSIDSTELNLMETHVVNSTNLQQKFVEVFEKVLGSLNGTAESKESHKEGSHREKRNALLHPRSWESRERNNLLHQKRTSAESMENMIPTEAMTDVPHVRDGFPVGAIEESTTTEISARRTTKKPSEDVSVPPGVKMVRTVSKLVKSVTSEFNRVLSKLMKTKN